MLLRLSALIAALLLAGMAWTSAQTGPILTDVQVLRIQNAILKVQLAQSELERAKESANVLIQSLQVKGYTLDLERGVYVPVKETETTK